jgi:hypothetical protein
MRIVTPLVIPPVIPANSKADAMGDLDTKTWIEAARWDTRARRRYRQYNPRTLA